MKKGCLFIGISLAVVFVLTVAYCGHSLDSSAREELPKISAITTKFAEHYNNNDNESMYALVDSSFRASISKENNKEQMARIKETTGSITIGDLIQWFSQSVNTQKYFTVSYSGNTDKGKIVLTIKYHMEDTWKLQSYNINFK